MKTTILSVAAVIVTLATFLAAGTLVSVKEKGINSSQLLGEKVITSLQQSSFEQYALLFPSLQEFQQVMNENSKFYGSHLSDAQADFSTGYESKLLPALKESFAKLVREGKEKGINWRSVKYIGTETNETTDANFGKVSITIVFISNGKAYRIALDNALIINGQWRVGQQVKLG
jgi:hypothetical protein